MLDPSAFLYDQQASLELTVLSEGAQEGTTIQDIMYSTITPLFSVCSQRRVCSCHGWRALL